MPKILMFRRLRQKDLKSKVSLTYIVRPYLKKKKKKKTKKHTLPQFVVFSNTYCPSHGASLCSEKF
jgi:hypothetical protein